MEHTYTKILLFKKLWDSNWTGHPVLLLPKFGNPILDKLVGYL